MVINMVMDYLLDIVLVFWGKNLVLNLHNFLSHSMRSIDESRSLKTHGQESKHLPNSPILSNNHKLRGIVVNKG